MSIDGFWTGEVYGAFGWENRGVFLLDHGRMVGSDNRQYSTGTYNVSGDRITAELRVHYYVPPLTVFGEKSEAFTVEFDGKLEGDVIDGTIHRPDRAKSALQCQFTKRMGLSGP